MGAQRLSVRVLWAIALAGGAIANLALPGEAQNLINATIFPEVDSGIVHRRVPEGSPQENHEGSITENSPPPATTVKDWLAQIEATTVQVTRIELERTDTQLDIILETAEGKPLQIDATQLRQEGNSLIAEIPNAVLVLPEGQSFIAENPTADIATVQVVQQDTSTIQVNVTGNVALPQTEVMLKTGELAYSLNPEGEEEETEIIVTAEREQDGYRVPNSTTATKTDTPLRDIPQSIQVVPKQVLQDRQAKSITDGLENVSGVTSISTAAGSRDYFTIRGFEYYGNAALVNGLPDPQITSDASFVNVEQLEVLKGPASVLYGETGFSALGGTLNFVTKQPLRDPFYEISTTIGSFNDYQGAIDLSGPLNDSKTALYRFNAGYRSTESFVDFNDARKLSVAPSLSFGLGENTDLALEGDVNIFTRNSQQPDSLPAVGTVLPNPNGRIRRSFSAKGELTDNLTINGRFGYRLEHRFNENWKLRNAFRYTFYDDDDRNGAPDFNATGLAADNRTLNRDGIIGEQFYDFYYLDTNLLGKFSTGSIDHQLLIGFSLSRNITDLNFEFGIPAAPVDVFNPVYDNTVVSTGRNFIQLTTRDTLGLYLQDQITLTENLKILLGGRVDFFEERKTDRLTNIETSQSDTVFSPRLGIVYQPIQPISLYASFAQSFAPTIGISASGEAFQPERGTQYEVGVKADLTSNLSTTLAFYDLTRSNVSTTDPNNSIFSVQTGKQRSRGIELDISGEILPGWNIIAGYAYTDAKVIADNTIPVGNRLFAAPEHAFNLWTTYRIQKGGLQGLGFGLGFYYAGETEADLANTFEVPSYFRTDAAIFYERGQFRASVNFRNLFDVEYYRATGSGNSVGVGEPFTVQGTLSWKF
jgi:iron complex outermembrane recepter protein